MPDETLTLLTAAIDEHVFTAGLDYKHDWFTCELAHQYHISHHQHVDQSGLLSGEYTDIDINVAFHTLAVTIGVEF